MSDCDEQPAAPVQEPPAMGGVFVLTVEAEVIPGARDEDEEADPR
jgi:hypothetical protein